MNRRSFFGSLLAGAGCAAAMASRWWTPDGQGVTPDRSRKRTVVIKRAELRDVAFVRDAFFVATAGEDLPANAPVHIDDSGVAWRLPGAPRSSAQ